MEWSMEKSSRSRVNFFGVRVISVCLLALSLSMGIQMSGSAKSQPGGTTARSLNALANSFSATPAKRDSLSAGKLSNAPLFTCTWTGSVNTDWSTAGNWSGCNSTVPQAGDTVSIGGAANQPTLSATAPSAGTLSTVTVSSGGTLTVTGGGTLNTSADFSLNGGTLSLSGGTVNVGTSAQTNLLYASGSTLTITSGALNIGGRFSPSTTTPDTITYNQSGGTVTVDTFLSDDGNFGSFSIPATGSSFTMSDGSIIHEQTTVDVTDYVNLASAGTVTGGTLQIGDSNTTSGSKYGIRTTPPVFNLIVANSNVNRLNISSDVMVNSTLTLSGGNITNITNDGSAVIIGTSGAIIRTAGWVIPALEKNGLSSNFTFHVGTASGYTPLSLANVSGGGNLRVKTNGGPHPAVNASTSLKEYWTLTQSGPLTADITFQYLLADVAGNEANYRVIRILDSTPVSFPTSSIDTINHRGTLTGVKVFSADWTLGENSAPTAAPATISGQIATADGRPLGGVTVSLSGKKSDRTITDANGQYHFDNVDTDGFYAVTPGLVNYAFSPASRSFALLADRTDAVFTATTLTESDNPVNGADYFVRQQYLDFLGREPDHDGWLFWTDQISRCGTDKACLRQRRLDVSAAFFMSDEFQQSGSYIYRLYRAALGRQLSYGEFTAGRKLVVGGPDLEVRKTAFAESFVQRPEFLQRYQDMVSAESFVDLLLQNVLQNTGLEFSNLRDSLIQTYNRGSNLNRSRSAVLSELAENSGYQSAVFNSSFVLMEYFGYLQRDADRPGYDYWLNVLDGREQGNYRGMVCAFVTSTEYQRRFSSVVTRNNGECSR